MYSRELSATFHLLFQSLLKLSVAPDHVVLTIIIIKHTTNLQFRSLLCSRRPMFSHLLVKP
jgi:hypothetical protein